MNTPGDKKLKIGSLFAGIGGFELGIERAIPNAETVWQVEQNKYCQGILKKHWPNATIYDDVRNITQHNVEPVDILIGGFPCQSISVAGKQRGLEDEKKSGLWWEFHRIISELRPRIVVMENVANVLRLGGLDVVGSLAKIGYDAEWTIISAKQFGAPHLRKRWFCVAYPNTRRKKSTVQTRRQEDSCRLATNSNSEQLVTSKSRNSTKRSKKITSTRTLDTMDENRRNGNVTDSDSDRRKNQSMHSKQTHGKTRDMLKHSYRTDRRSENYWQRFAPESPLCNVDDGIPQRVARLKALGNAIVPQCSQYIGECIVRSGLLDEI